MGNIDLHNHVIPENVIQPSNANRKSSTPKSRKKRQTLLDNHGRIAELLPEFHDVGAKLSG